MNQKYIVRENHPKLLLLFAGWACDETPFQSYRPTEMDFMVCYDYRTLDFDYTVFQQYEWIGVVGWSMGVWAAGYVLNKVEHFQGTSIAFNGTGRPCDNLYGIPENIFADTLEQLSPGNLQRFMRRICGSGNAYRQFMQITPKRNFAEVKDELQAVQDMILKHSNNKKEFEWTFDKAVLGKNDAIFPVENMERYFLMTGKSTDIQYVDTPHYSQEEFQHLLQDDWNDKRPLYIDKQWVARCFAHSRNTYEKEACVQRQVAEKMMRLLKTTWTDQNVAALPKRVVEVGCGTGSFSRLLADQLQPASLLLNDLCPEMKECLDDVCSHSFTTFQPGDAERMPLPPESQLIASCSTIQWFHHPEAFFKKCHQALSTDGWLAFSTFGKKNMYEIKELTGRGLYYQTLEEHKQLLEPMFQVIYAEEEVAKLNFATPLDVLKHLKQTGVTGTEKRVWSPGRLQRFCQEYLEKFSVGPQSVSLTYHPIYIIAKKI